MISLFYLEGDEKNRFKSGHRMVERFTPIKFYPILLFYTIGNLEHRIFKGKC